LGLVMSSMATCPAISVAKITRLRLAWLSVTTASIGRDSVYRDAPQQRSRSRYIPSWVGRLFFNSTHDLEQK
jgi:hypothetical protein